MNSTWAVRSATAGAVLLVGVLAPNLALAGSTKVRGADSPQTPERAAVATAPAPSACLLTTQQNPAEQKYRKTNNDFHTYDASAVNTAYFNVDCGALTFSVPRGKQALVDLSATAELDCEGPPAGNTWCEGRFLVNGLPTPMPDNTGRNDTYAWDSGNGGNFDWQAHSVEQEYVARCPKVRNTTTPCVYQVTLQSRLVNGATSLWVDDLTVRVDVTEGPVTVRSVTR